MSEPSRAAKKKIILASSSNWRKELLTRARIEFEVDPSNYQESFGVDENPSKIAEKLAIGKAEDVAIRHTNAIIIGADTVIVFNGEPLGKPLDQEEARAWLLSMSGNMVEAYTGVCLIDTSTGTLNSFTDKTEMNFRDLTEEEIEEYLATDEPQTVAGAFAVQGGASSFIKNVNGDFYTIVGLPLARTIETLRAMQNRTLNDELLDLPPVLDA